jgi:hypothetical protein
MALSCSWIASTDGSDEGQRSGFLSPDIRSGVSAIMALTHVAAIDCPRPFRSSKRLAPVWERRDDTSLVNPSGRDHQGETGGPGSRSSGSACHHDACGPLVSTQGLAMHVWPARRGANGKVALARKLAVILHRMWIAGTEFQS